MPDSNEDQWSIPVGTETTTAILDRSESSDGIVFVCAHGAGGHMADRGMLALTKELCSTGLDIVRFNFLYREKGSGRPDPMPRLEECFAAVVARARDELNPRVLIIGGRSMGGRAASMMTAKNFQCNGLLLFAYPLHPAGQPTKLRDAHLPSIKVPVVCFNGTRDALCTPELMEEALKTVNTTWDMHWLPGADHSFHVLKSSGTTDAAVLAEVGEATQKWIGELQ